MRVLLVEDDFRLGPRLKGDLEQAGYVADLVTDGITAEFMGSTEPYDLIVLDLELPKLSGLKVLSAWRAAGNTVPVLILTANDSWEQRVDGFKAGADDYLGKPFSTEELLARINAIIKRCHGSVPQAPIFDGLRLDEDRQMVQVGSGGEESLTSMEFRLLRLFMLNPGKLLSKSYLVEHLYGAEADMESNTLEVYIKRVRRKIGEQRIQTRRGQGYVLSAISSETHP